MLSRYGRRVAVFEAHSAAGGVAHTFRRNGYTFDSGPSFHAGLSSRPSPNPLKQVCPHRHVMQMFEEERRLNNFPPSRAQRLENLRLEKDGWPPPKGVPQLEPSLTGITSDTRSSKLQECPRNCKSMQYVDFKPKWRKQKVC